MEDIIQQVINAEEEFQIHAQTMNTVKIGYDIAKDKVASKRKLLLDEMKSTGECLIKTKYHSASLKRTPPKLVIKDESAVPDMFVKVERRVNKVSLKKFLNAGNDVEYAALETEYTVQIRTN